MMAENSKQSTSLNLSGSPIRDLFNVWNAVVDTLQDKQGLKISSDQKPDKALKNDDVFVGLVNQKLTKIREGQSRADQFVRGVHEKSCEKTEILCKTTVFKIVENAALYEIVSTHEAGEHQIVPLTEIQKKFLMQTCLVLKPLELATVRDGQNNEYVWVRPFGTTKLVLVRDQDLHLHR